jgi:hypothetical protein
MSYEIEALLEKAGLTEYKPRQWCQSGAQAGWSPDLDGVTPCVEIHGEAILVANINNDLYSLRVKEIEAGLKTLGVRVVVLDTHEPEESAKYIPPKEG